jgi:adhesin transport system outer membrane protein
MRFRFAFLVGVLAFFAIAAPAATFAAEPTTTVHLTLADAIARALSENAAAQLATSEIARAESLAAQARAALLPQVNGSALESNQSINFETFGFIPPGLSPVVGPFYVFDAHVTAAMNVLQIAARKRLAAARQGITVARAERLETENQVAGAVSTLYIALLRARAQSAANLANVELADRLAASADRQLDAGTATRIDSTRAQVQLARQRDALIAAQTAEGAAQFALLRAIGAPLDATLALDDPLLDRPRTPLGLDEALRAALAERPRPPGRDRAPARRRAPARQRQGRAPADDRRAGAGRLQRQQRQQPALDALRRRRAHGADLHRGSIPARIAEAEIRVEETRIHHHDLERQAEQEVRYALLTYDAARSRVELAERNRALAAEELEHARDRFSNGVASALEVDNAQNSIASAADTRVAGPCRPGPGLGGCRARHRPDSRAAAGRTRHHSALNVQGNRTGLL